MPLHPLEPLSALEISQAVRLLKSSPMFTPTTRVISIILREPEKSTVLFLSSEISYRFLPTI